MSCRVHLEKHGELPVAKIKKGDKNNNRIKKNKNKNKSNSPNKRNG
jgi:hypothetical protein